MKIKRVNEMNESDLKVGDWIESNGDTLQITAEMIEQYRKTKSLMGMTDWKKVENPKTKGKGWKVRGKGWRS